MENTLKTLLPDWYALLQGWALDGSLSAAAQEALMLEGTPDALQDLVNLLGAGNSAESHRSCCCPQRK
jgi:HEAT repeat protein